MLKEGELVACVFGRLLEHFLVAPLDLVLNPE